MTTDNKVYILQKEVLNYSSGHVIAAGEEFEKEKAGKNWYRSKNGWVMSPEAIANKDWFKLKPENKSNDSFQWTDELVAQAFEYIREDSAGVLTPYGVRQNVKYFKEKKEHEKRLAYLGEPQAENKPDRDDHIGINRNGYEIEKSKPTEQRIEVNTLELGTNIPCVVDYNKVKQAIEQVLNDDKKTIGIKCEWGTSFISKEEYDKEVDAMCEDVWNAARKIKASEDYEYPSFKNYKNQKSKQ